jgi:hypothetical protein
MFFHYPKGVSLFQKARTSPINGMYYDNASVGHNKLGTFMTETLQKIEVNRDENLKLLKQKKSLIIKQVRAAKSKVLKYLDVVRHVSI